MNREQRARRAADIRRELSALDKSWARLGRAGQRRVEVRMHTLRAELRQIGGASLPAVVSGPLAGVRAW